ncbi:MAG: YdcH family protein [Pikeienuella sp.]
MTGSGNLMEGKEVLRFKLEELRRRHRSLDDAIAALELSVAGRDSLDLRRLKKQKLALKDEIFRLEDQITPDIIA